MCNKWDLFLLANSPKWILFSFSSYNKHGDCLPLQDMKPCRLWCATRQQQPLLPLNILTHNSALLLHAINSQGFNLQRGREGGNERAAQGDKEGRDKHEHRGLQAPLWMYWWLDIWFVLDIVPADVTRNVEETCERSAATESLIHLSSRQINYRQTSITWGKGWCKDQETSSLL